MLFPLSWGALHGISALCAPCYCQKWILRIHPQNLEWLQAGEDEPVGIPRSHHPNLGQTQPSDKTDPIAERLLNICKDMDKGTHSNVSPSLQSVLWTSKK